MSRRHVVTRRLELRLVFRFSFHDRGGLGLVRGSVVRNRGRLDHLDGARRVEREPLSDAPRHLQAVVVINLVEPSGLLRASAFRAQGPGASFPRGAGVLELLARVRRVVLWVGRRGAARAGHRVRRGGRYRGVRGYARGRVVPCAERESRGIRSRAFSFVISVCDLEKISHCQPVGCDPLPVPIFLRGREMGGTRRVKKRGRI